MGAQVVWFRGRTEWVCALTLPALTLPLIASFGHVHTLNLPGSQSLTIAGDPAAYGAADQHEHAGFCGVCRAVQPLSNAQIAVPPLLPVADVFTRTAICVLPPNPVALPDCQAFQSRAPPSA
jgi:hypothetical protein